MVPRPLIALAVLAILYAGCARTPTAPTPIAADPVNAIQTSKLAPAPSTIQEARQREGEIFIPSLEAMAVICEEAQRANPDADDQELLPFVWHQLATAKVDARAAATYLGRRVTNEEFWLLMANPTKAAATNRAADDASREASRQWPGNQADTKADAFRHACWNILLSKRIAHWWAIAFTEAHESETPDGQPRRMDLNNNEVGQDIFIRNQQLSESRLSSLLKQWTYTYSSLIRVNFRTSDLLYIRS